MKFNLSYLRNLVLCLFVINLTAFSQSNTGKVTIKYKYLNIKEKKAFVKLQGSTFSAEMETDWQRYNPTNRDIDRGAYPKKWSIYGNFLPNLKFGFNKPWEYIFDLDIHETKNGIITVSKGYQTVVGSGIPYSKITRTFWNNPEMVYEVSESNLAKYNRYFIAGDDSALFKIKNSISYHKNGIIICWQFYPEPKSITFIKNEGYICDFDTNRVETLITWGKQDSFRVKTFQSASNEMGKLKVQSINGQSRIYEVNEKQQCMEPGESIQLPDNEFMLTNIDTIRNNRMFLKQGLHEFVIRKEDKEKIVLGGSTFYSLNTIVDSKSVPDIKSFLVRALRSLSDRIIFGVVTEDDPTQDYIWGTGTWPRCLSILSLDYFGFSADAYNYLEFMLNVSRQFEFKDKNAHLWDSFYMTGDRREVYYDINGHSFKLFEAGKFYLNHRNDEYGKKILDEQYQTLREWCYWIEEHIEKTGLILDLTESNVWSYGYGVFTQAPSIAGIKLFIEMAKDKKQTNDVAHFSKVVNTLLTSMNELLYGDCENHFLNIKKGIGNSYTTYIPNKSLSVESKIGLSCYSLAPHFFLLDPDVKLVDKNDIKITSTLDLSLDLLGNINDKRIINWHTMNNISHIGYGQGQLLMALLYTKKPVEFNERLTALFDITKSSTGDKYLIPEILGRPDKPNKGNKAQLTYYPYLVAYLGGLSHTGGIMKDFVKDLEVHRYKEIDNSSKPKTTY